jgi:hypothetical protein
MATSIAFSGVVDPGKALEPLEPLSTRRALETQMARRKARTQKTHALSFDPNSSVDYGKDAAVREPLARMRAGGPRTKVFSR